jgi:predicted enzyme related to lactoylglutathione lyase
VFPTLGEICWLEVPCNDIARVVGFYSTVLGWDSPDPASSPPPQPGAMEGTDAVHMFTHGKLNGAFVKMTKPEDVAAVADPAHPAKAGVLASYLVSSIEETLKKVEDAGGRVHVYVLFLNLERDEN